MTAKRNLTAAEVVELLRLPSLNALYQLNRRGTGPKPIKRGKRGPLLYSTAAIEAWERAHTA